MFPLTELQVIVVLTAMLTLPGWAALSLSDLWRRWGVLQRWIVAVGLSIAFYPVFFYSLRSVLPFMTLGPYKMGALLLGFAAVTAWRIRPSWKKQFALDRLEWIAVAIFGLTLLTRFWVIRGHPYPAWSDSLHHAILTRLTAVQGQLPETMEPYFPIPLDQYHLGLYSLTATTQWLAQVPAHTALLWTAQALNGLCGLGVYLVVDRKMGRVGAIVGAATVGLLSHQPAFYVNWGRFTQLSGQTILLIAWLATWEAMKAWRLSWREHKAQILWLTGLAGVLTGAVFLLHFRVAAFLIPLLATSVLWELWKECRDGQPSSVVRGTVAVALASLLVASPAMVGATSGYVSGRLNATSQSQAVLSPSEATETAQRYYEFPLSTVPYLAAHTWLLVLSGLGVAVGLIRRNRLVVASLVWAGVLYLLGRAYLLPVPLLSLTNMGAVLILLYLPIGLVVGSATEEVLKIHRPRWRGVANAAVALALIGGFVGGHARTEDLEAHRFFVTAEDVAAMDWIRQSTPEDALFAVNTTFWLPRAPHGTDAGYWIPYFTGRQTTAGTMLSSMGSADHQNRLVALSRMVEELEHDNEALAGLRDMGVDYVYIGRNGDFSGAGLNAEYLSQGIGAEVSYEEAGVFILGLSSD